MPDTMPSGPTQAVHLEQISQIAITVRDLARSREFYQNTLGMKFLFDAGQMVFFQCGTVRLMLGTSGSQQETTASPATTILYFKVEDIQAAHVALLARSVPFSHPPHLVAKMPDHYLWMAFLTDPDGNTLALMSEVRSR